MMYSPVGRHPQMPPAFPMEGRTALHKFRQPNMLRLGVHIWAVI